MTKQNIPLWTGVFPLWIKYCGVCDEYVSLKSKWQYISSISGLNPFPSDFNQNFKRIDQFIDDTDRLFMGPADSPQLERIRKYQCKNFDPNFPPEMISELQNRLFSLSHYLGILKFVFFQRTVSFDIQEVASGLPTSPEITSGNEAIYLAADNVAKRYMDSINRDSGLIWDQAISFVYPVQQDNFFGGYSRPDRYLKSVHILLSEENKHFLGSLLILAHEASHASHYIISSNDCLLPRWVVETWNSLYDYQKHTFNDKIEQLQKDCSDNDCYCLKHMRWLYSNSANEGFSSEEFRQHIADLIALLIAGPMSSCVLSDTLLKAVDSQRNFPLRIAFLLGYCLEKKISYTNILEREIFSLQELWEKNLNNYNPYCPKIKDPSFCFQILVDIGIQSGVFFAKNEVELFKKGNIESLDIPNIKHGDSIISSIIRDPFKIEKQDEDRICSALLSLEPCPNEDPRSILHCAYTLYRKGTAVSYATVLFSLAYNTYKSEKK